MTNPLLRVVDVAAVAGAVHKIRDDIVVIVDNTFMTPWNMRPLDLGADIVVHSATKYINGHSDVVCGLLSTNSSNMREALFMTQITLGAVPSPFDSYLVNRGMKTLHLRMPRHAENAMKVAEWLEANPRIEKVYYPGKNSNITFSRKIISKGFHLIQNTIF
jgi:cystathionine gamma-lyase